LTIGDVKAVADLGGMMSNSIRLFRSFLCFFVVALTGQNGENQIDGRHDPSPVCECMP